MSSFSITRALYSPSYAFKMWCEYVYGNNRYGMTVDDFEQVEDKWAPRLTEWKKQAEKAQEDINQYDIDGDVYDDTTSQLEDSATGHHPSYWGCAGTVGKSIITTGVTAFGAAAGGCFRQVSGTGAARALGSITPDGVAQLFTKQTVTGAETVAYNAAIETAKESGKEISDDALKSMCKEAADEAGEQAKVAIGKNIGIYASCIMGLATGSLWVATKPNEDAVNDLNSLQGVVSDATAESYAAQGEMARMNDELNASTKEAEEVNNAANNEMKELKGQEEYYKRIYNQLSAKISSGIPLNESEKSMYAVVVNSLQQTGDMIQDTSDKASDDVASISYDMRTNQQVFDEKQKDMTNHLAIIDYSKSFDKSTALNTKIEAGSQLANAASSGLAAFQALGTGWWGALFAAAGFAGAGMSGIGAATEFKWSKVADNAVANREISDEVYGSTVEAFDFSVETFNNDIETVENLGLEIPDVEPFIVQSIPESSQTDYDEDVEDSEPPETPDVQDTEDTSGTQDTSENPDEDELEEEEA